MDYFPAGENCCVEMPGARYVWVCKDYSDPEPDKGAGPPCDKDVQCCSEING